MAVNYDVIIVGAGPAGIFAALELADQNNLKVLLLEEGKGIDERLDIINGFGGAGAFSDGKLTLSSAVGGILGEFTSQDIDKLIKYVDDTYLSYGAPQETYGTGKDIQAIMDRAVLAQLRLVPVPIRHLGTDRCRQVIKAMYDHLSGKIDVHLEEKVADILVADGSLQGVATSDGTRYSCRYLVAAPGREGSDWLSRQAKKLGLTLHTNPVDVGVRIEVPAPVMDPLTDLLYEVKLEYLSSSFDDRVRTFCMCPRGEVILEKPGGEDPVITVNGQSFATNRTQNTNFALLVSTAFTEPFHEPIAYGKYLARLANILSGGILVQRLGDLLSGRRSTPARIQRGLVKPTLASATPGDLSFVMPYRYLTGIIEMLKAMERLAPGTASPHTLLYGIEVKFYSSRPQLSCVLETELAGLFAVGDGAGVSRGLVQASASGVIAGREILARTAASSGSK